MPTSAVSEIHTVLENPTKGGDKIDLITESEQIPSDKPECNLNLEACAG